MPTNDEKKSAAAIIRQAVQWHLRMNGRRPLTRAEGRRLLAWLLASPRHMREFLAVGRLNDWVADFFRSRGPSRSNVIRVNWWQGSKLKSAVTGSRRSKVGWGVAATVAVLSFALFGVVAMQADVPTNIIATAADEVRTEQLEDGSEVTLAADTKIRVDYSEHRRQVHLLQGTVTFSVEKDTLRPFVVATPVVYATAVGTKFTVKMLTSGVGVNVLEGVVEVARVRPEPGSMAATLRHGEGYEWSMDDIPGR
jgi:transmembrane sensor